MSHEKKTIVTYHHSSKCKVVHLPDIWCSCLDCQDEWKKAYGIGRVEKLADQSKGVKG